MLKTKQLAEMCGVKPIELRRVLRTMPRYDDGVQTHYIWDETSDKALIDEIKAKVAAWQGKRTATSVETPKAETPKAETPKAETPKPHKSK